MIFDTHTHYDDKQYDKDRDDILSGMRERGVGTIVNVGAEREGCRVSVELADRYDFVYAALGIHPDEVGHLDEDFFSWMRETAKNHPKVVAIGEIGLDYHWDVEPRRVQQEWFVRQMELARDLSLPIAVHSREAAKDTYDLIARHGRDLGGILHCYAYSSEMALKYVKMGYHIGLGGVVTFKNAKKAKETAAAIPLENLVLETDCPYMAPVPFRGKRNSSDLLVCVAEEIARLRGIPAEEVIDATEKNARRLFRVESQDCEVRSNRFS